MSAPRAARTVVAVLAAAVLAVSLLLTGCRVLTPSPWLLVLATAFVPFALPGYLLTGLLSVLLRRGASGEARRWSTGVLVVALAGAVVHAGLLAPSYVGDHPRGPADLTVLTVNLRVGRADSGEVVTLVRRTGADLVVLEEVTGPEASALVGAGIRRDLEYAAGSLGTVSQGTMVLSRFPLDAVRRLPVRNGAWLMQVHAPRPFTLLAAHASQPLYALDAWRSDHAAIRRAVEARTGPLVVAGDFNATLDHAPMRALLRAGLADAARQANAGWQPTWPGDPEAYAGLPLGVGVMALDHVLVSEQLGAVATKTHEVAGTDHRALIARLAWR